jgi:hypothetical protein
MKTNTIITKTFTYDIPDDYLHQTRANSLTGTFTYEGPDKMWIFINSETNKMQSSLVYTEKEDGADIPVGVGSYKVCIDANVDPEIASMIWNGVDYSTLPTVAEDLPDGTQYIRPVSPPPDHTYELSECVYDPVAGAWVKPLPWKQPHMTWDELKTARRMMLQQSDKIIATALLTDEQKTEWNTYRQALRDLPELFTGIDPWKVPFPVEPVTGA